jgi:hypothetical protein
MIDGQPTFEKPLDEILGTLKKGGAIKTMTAAEYISDRQRAWYRGPCLTGLSQWNGETVDEWDYRLKSLCNGVELLKMQDIYMGQNESVQRLSISGVGKKNMTAFIENILSLAITEDWPVTAPDKDLRA